MATSVAAADRDDSGGEKRKPNNALCEESGTRREWCGAGKRHQQRCDAADRDGDRGDPSDRPMQRRPLPCKGRDRD